MGGCRGQGWEIRPTCHSLPNLISWISLKEHQNAFLNSGAFRDGWVWLYDCAVYSEQSMGPGHGAVHAMHGPLLREASLRVINQHCLRKDSG
jgi:hypothetical protein